MYNRYIPQSDGSFLKTSLREPESPQQAPQKNKPPEIPLTAQIPRNREPVGIGSFFQNLIPRGLDTEDLIIILLLLLMSQDKSKNGNRAMLTLGAYLFL